MVIVDGNKRRNRMKRNGFFVFLIALSLIFSSCASLSPMHEREVASTLPYEVPMDECIGLLNPDAEIRGVWIATVGNINFPSKSGLSQKALKAELDAIVENCSELGLNAIFFQVRPAADSLYKSSLFPASEYVSGKQGQMPQGDFDCLQYLIEIAHKKKINVHAWINPLRVTYGSAKYPKTDLSSLSENHIARKNPDWCIPYADGKLYFDAGIPEVREYIAKGVAEVVENYQVDGVVFDDYFYPYPVSGAEFDDSASYEKYGSGNLSDWRRDNINSLIRSCFEAVKNSDPDCLFGISPFGIWQNDDGENGGSKTRGLEAYESLYCDALSWAKDGYVDYIAPQLYWRFETAVAPYGELSDWWNAALDGTGVKLLISHAAYMYESWEDPEGELTGQIEFSRNALNYRGSILYGYEAIDKNSAEIRQEISKAFAFDIVYSDYYPTSAELVLTGLPENGVTKKNRIFLEGSSDPTLSLSYNGQNLNRDKWGDFSLELKLISGENTLVFDYGGKEIYYHITKED